MQLRPVFRLLLSTLLTIFMAENRSLFRNWMLFPLGVSAFAATLVWSGWSHAQDDPFDFGAPAAGANDPIFGGDTDLGFGGVGQSGGLAGDADATRKPSDPLIGELRRFAGGSPSQLGLAIREAIRLRNWNEVALYSGGGRVTGLDDAGKLAVAQRIGSLYLVRALTEVALAEDAKGVLDQLAQLLRTNAMDSDRLDQAIETLKTGNLDQRLGAVRMLRAGGDASMERIIRASLKTQSQQELGRLMEVLSSFGDSGAQALEVLASFGSEATRPNALRALHTLDPKRALKPILAAGAARGAGDQERSVAAELIRNSLGGLPSVAEVQKYLAKQLEIANEEFVVSRTSDASELVWQVTEDRDSVEMVVTSGRSARSRKAADLAELLRRTGTLESDVRQAAFAADLRNRFLNNPEFGSVDDAKTIAQLWGRETLDVQALNVVLADALGTRISRPLHSEPNDPNIGDPALAIAVIRVLGVVGDVAAVEAAGGDIAPLVQAASHTIAQVRYEAAAVIGSLHPDRPYSGSSVVLDRWVEMSHLEATPRAIILLNDPNMRRAIVERLTKLGYRITQVSSVEEMIVEVDKGGDLQLMVATHRPPDYATIEMIDRVRRRPLGGSAPLLIVNGWPAGYEQFSHRWRAANVMLATAPEEVRRELAPGEAVMKMQIALNDLARSAPVEPLTAGDREIYAIAGLTGLTRLIEDANVAEIYDWRGREADLVDASRRSGFSEDSLRILSALGTPYSQDLLARLAANPVIALDTRKNAAKAFADSVSKSGTRISRRQVLQQYDKYNQSDDADMRAVLDTIIDAIEVRAGITTP